MVEKNYTITNESGIHARPATIIVNSASKFKSDLTPEYKGRQVNLKSIMGVMSLGIPNGASVKIIANGDDESQAIEAIENVLKKEGLSE